MPLEQHIPKIDDRRFEDIVTEVRARIPRYTPEWTDFNDSDPGMTVVQLFAWMCDLLLYRLGKVPELNYLKFLQLIGIELAPPRPASAEIAFPLRPDAPPFAGIRQGTPVAAEVAGETTPVVFETTEPLVAIAARLAAVQTEDGYTYFNRTNENNSATETYEPLGPAAAANAGVLLGFDYVGPFPEVELNLAVFAAESSSEEAMLSCGLAAPAFSGPALLSWEYWAGTEWRTLALLKDETRGLQRSGHIYLKTPQAGRIARAIIGSEPQNLYWIRGRVIRASYDRVPVLLAIRTNTVRALQVETVRDEVLGGTTGDPDLVLRIAQPPVLPDSLVIEIDEGSGPQPWKRADDFFGSKRTDRHYVLNATTGEIRFGDGVLGAIPAANFENPGGNVVATIYQHGGGKRGNVDAGAIRTPLVSLAGVADDQVHNLLPALGGRDEQSIDDAKKRASAVIRSNGRAVTAADFEELAMQTGSVRRAKALPLVHPRFPGTQIPGTVTVVVVPDNDQPRPAPSEATLLAACAYLNQRRLLTTEVFVIPPQYLEVQVSAEVIAGNTADVAQVKTAIGEALETYFHALRGGDDGLGWPFGGDIFFSKVYRRILSVPGVERVSNVTIRLEGEDAQLCRDVPVPLTALLYSGAHDIQVDYGVEE